MESKCRYIYTVGRSDSRSFSIYRYSFARQSRDTVVSVVGAVTTGLCKFSPNKGKNGEVGGETSFRWCRDTKRRLYVYFVNELSSFTEACSRQDVTPSDSFDPVSSFDQKVVTLRNGDPNKSFHRLYRVFRNLWHSLRELIVRLKVMKKKSDKYMSYLSSFMRYNEFSVLITITNDARNDHLAFEDKHARVLSLIWLLSLSFLVFLEFVGSLALFYLVVSQHFQSMLRTQ